MGLRAPFAVALMLALNAPAEAAPRAKTRFDGIRDCERTGNAQFKRHDQAFKRFTIDRAGVKVDRFADRVGPLFIATVYHGRASYDGGKGAQQTQFICLHGGGGKGALFVYTLSD